MKEILLISQSGSKYGGTEYDFLKLFDFLKEKNSVNVICPYGERFDYFKSKSSRIFKIRFNVFPLFVFNWKSFIRYSAIYLYEYRKLRSFLSKGKFDIAIINSTVCFLYLRVLKKHKIRTMIFLREDVRNHRLKKIIYRYIQKFADIVIAGSKAIYEGYEILEGSSKLELIYTTTDINEIAFRDLSNNRVSEKSKRVLLNIGGIGENKNQEILIKAGNHLSGEFKLEIIFIGDTMENKYEAKIKSLIPREGNTNVVFQFHNFMNKDLIKEYYLNADFVVITSKSEGMPIVLLEALYFGKVVIAPPIGLVPELIVDSVNGFIYELNDCKSLYLTIRKAFESKNLESIQQEAMKTFDKYPTLSQNLKRTEELIGEVLK